MSYTSRLYLEDDAGHKLLLAKWNTDYECWDMSSGVNDIEDFLNNAYISKVTGHPDEGNLNIDITYEIGHDI